MKVIALFTNSTFIIKPDSNAERTSCPAKGGREGKMSTQRRAERLWEKVRGLEAGKVEAWRGRGRGHKLRTGTVGKSSKTEDSSDPPLQPFYHDYYCFHTCALLTMKR